METMWSKHSRDSGRDRQAIVAEDLSHIPMGRFQDPADVANAVLFLASDEARYITGINILVDGGMELVM